MQAKKQLPLQSVFGLLLVVFSSLVLYGWFAHNPTLVQIKPHFVPVKANTALGFLFFGLFWLALSLKNAQASPAWNRKFTALRVDLVDLSLLIPFIFSVVTLVEHITFFSLGIDEIITKDFITFHTLNPGRQTLSATLCTLLSSVALFLFRRKESPGLPFVSLLFANLIFLTALYSLVSYIAGLTSSFGPGQIAKMGLPTSIAFVLQSILIFYYAWRNYRTQQGSPHSAQKALAAAGFTYLLAGSIWSWNFFAAGQQADALIHKDLNQMASVLQLRLQNFLENTDLLEAALRKHPNAESVDQIAQLFFSSHDEVGILFIHDPKTKFHKSWQRQAEQLPLDQSLEQILKQKPDLPRFNERFRFLESIRLASGDIGLALLSDPKTPLQQPPEILILWNFANQVSPLLLHPSYEIKIFNETKLVFERSSEEKNTILELKKIARIKNNPRLHLTLEITPGENLVRELLSPWHGIGVILSVLLALLVSGLLYFLLRNKEHEVALSTARDLLSQSLAAGDAGAWSWDILEQKLQYDQNTYKLLGYTSYDFASPEAFWNNLVHPEDKPLVEKRASQFLQGIEKEYICEFRMRHKDGRWIWLQTRGKIVQGQAQAIPTRAIGIHTDVTKRKELELALEQQQAQILHNSKLVALGEMASGMAHEINNPLAILSVKLELLLDKVKEGRIDAKDLSRELISLFSTTHRIAKVVKSLRNLARPQDKDPQVPLPLKTALEAALDLSQERIKSAGIEIQLDLPSLPLTNSGQDFVVLGKESELTQAILNLLTNAREAVAESQERWIKVALFREENFAKLRVYDSGLGVAPEIREKIMRPFFTTKSAYGRGMGLSISSQIAERHGGQLRLVQADSTCFELSLPLHNTPSA